MFAFLIITFVGGLLTAGIGLWGYGAKHSFWPAGILPDLGQTNEIILMSVGGGTAFSSLTILLIKGCCDPFQKKTQVPQREPLSELEELRIELNNWEYSEFYLRKERIDLLKWEIDVLKGKFKLQVSDTEPIQKTLDAYDEVVEICSEISNLEKYPAVTETYDFIKIKSEYDKLKEEWGTLFAIKEHILESFVSKTTFLQIYCSLRTLASLPPSIGKLTHLERLWISGTAIQTLPSEIGELVNLKVLFLEDNALTTLPLELCKLQNLKKMRLHNNPFKSVPKEVRDFCQSRLDQKYGSSSNIFQPLADSTPPRTLRSKDEPRRRLF